MRWQIESGKVGDINLKRVMEDVQAHSATRLNKILCTTEIFR